MPSIFFWVPWHAFLTNILTFRAMYNIKSFIKDKGYRARCQCYKTSFVTETPQKSCALYVASLFIQDQHLELMQEPTQAK
jgi:hypothetical protein